MKKFITIATTLFAGTVYAKGPITLDANVDTIFIPNGFDDNDNVELVLHGDFPSTCYEKGEAQAVVDEANRVITVSANSIYKPDNACIQAITPYIQTVDIGTLTSGDYKVIYEPDLTVESSFTVKEGVKDSVDNHLYAPVNNAFIDVDFVTGNQALKLQGQFPYLFVGCMVMKEVVTYTGPEDVFVVQPIAEVAEGVDCEEQNGLNYRFSKDLSEPIYGEKLLHVRTTNGQSLNRYVQIK